MDLKVDNCSLPLDPYPCFLGITLDPKLDFKKHYEKISKKLASKINLIKRCRALRFKNKINLCFTIFKTLVRSLFDYSFIILNNDTQRISKSLQISQNKILRCIKYFPLKTTIKYIHTDLKIDTVEARAKKLLHSFIKSKEGTLFMCYE